MNSPTPWANDNECGHVVASAYQTHYCTYIRVPRLLSLQRPDSDHPDELIAILSLQAFELWFKVLGRDLDELDAALRSGSAQRLHTTKFLNRSIKLLDLLIHQTTLSADLLLRDAPLSIRINVESDRPRSTDLEAIIAKLDSVKRHIKDDKQVSANSRRLFQILVERFNKWSPQYFEFLESLITHDQDSPTLSHYLQIESLLELDTGVKADWTAEGEEPRGHSETRTLSADELMFIVVHQTFELWFRVVLSELDKVIPALTQVRTDLGFAIQKMNRITAIQHLLSEQIHFPATMTPIDFLQFRDQTQIQGNQVLHRGLSPASGTESFQFREIEIASGLKGSLSYREFLEGMPNSHTRFLTPGQERRFSQPSLPELFDRILLDRKIETVVELFSPSDQENKYVDVEILANLFLEYDEFFYIWRVNHLTMVQSMIGRKSGTGFLGPEYLKETAGMGLQGEDDRVHPAPQIRPRFFERLWEARTRLQSDVR